MPITKTFNGSKRSRAVQESRVGRGNAWRLFSLPVSSLEKATLLEVGL
jgi:hypothetical protein